MDLTQITINEINYTLNKGHQYSINNQKGELADTNFFGNELNYLIQGNGLEMPLTIHLYRNRRDHYRVFVYNNKGMLTSVNLSTGYSDGRVELKIQLKLSARNMTKEERACLRDLMVLDIENKGIEVEGTNTVCFGEYDVIEDKFIGSTPERFLEELIKVAIIKGHYMQNKGYELKGL